MSSTRPHTTLLLLLLLLTAALLGGAVAGKPLKVSQATRSLLSRHGAYAYSAYCPSAKISTWKCYWCDSALHLNITKVVYAAKTDNQAFVGYSTLKKEIVVSFRGTADLSIPNILQDLRVGVSFRPFRAPYQKVVVHKGFYSGYKNTAAGVIAGIKSARAKCRGCSLTITGHSLGGAIASVTAVELALKGTKVDRLVTFGSPRVGKADFKTMLNKLKIKSYRVTRGRDPVVRLPPVSFGYHHLAREYYMTSPSKKNSTTVSMCNGSGEDLECSRSNVILNPIDHFKYFRDLRDGKKSGC